MKTTRKKTRYGTVVATGYTDAEWKKLRINLAVIRLGKALAKAHPDRYPMEDQHILLSRILWARYFGPQARFRVGREDQWHAGEWLHNVGRDRRGQKEMKRLWDAGITEYQGRRIYGANSEPYTERWSRRQVFDIWLDIDLLPNLDKVIGGEIAQSSIGMTLTQSGPSVRS